MSVGGAMLLAMVHQNRSPTLRGDSWLPKRQYFCTMKNPMVGILGYILQHIPYVRLRRTLSASTSIPLCFEVMQLY